MIFVVRSDSLASLRQLLLNELRSLRDNFTAAWELFINLSYFLLCSTLNKDFLCSASLFNSRCYRILINLTLAKFVGRRKLRTREKYEMNIIKNSFYRTVEWRETPSRFSRRLFIMMMHKKLLSQLPFSCAFTVDSRALSQSSWSTVSDEGKRDTFSILSLSFSTALQGDVRFN